jgi:hypothetical protein
VQDLRGGLTIATSEAVDEPQLSLLSTSNRVVRGCEEQYQYRQQRLFRAREGSESRARANGTDEAAPFVPIVANRLHPIRSFLTDSALAHPILPALSKIFFWRPFAIRS